ncbi:hypothetical protein [Robinsoniella peoriensis]|uniref:hypothetical protein n=1 Tax=Robinsoniella peoriensis TaxID=180332 RepID=UPI00363721F2
MIRDLCYMYIESTEHFNQRIVVLFPYSLSKEKVLLDNVKNISKYIYKYIEAKEKYAVSDELAKQAIFDVNRMKHSLEADKQQKKIDELAELLNKDISPYRWSIVKGINERIDGVVIRADYACMLEKI